MMKVFAKCTSMGRMLRIVRMKKDTWNPSAIRVIITKNKIKRFKIPAMAYLNMDRIGEDSPESQIIDEVLLLNDQI